MPGDDSTGNLLQDLIARGVPAEAAQILQEAGAVIADDSLPVGELDAAHRSARMAIVGSGGSGAAALAQSMLARIKEAGLEDVFIIDSAASIPGQRGAARKIALLDDLNFGVRPEPEYAAPGFKKPKKVKVPKPAEERTQADLDALAAAQAKRARKALKLRGK